MNTVLTQQNLLRLIRARKPLKSKKMYVIFTESSLSDEYSLGVQSKSEFDELDLCASEV